MDKITIEHEANKSWQVAEVKENGKVIAIIHKFFEVEKDRIIIYETEGNAGTGYRPGNVEQIISLVGKEFELKLKR